MANKKPAAPKKVEAAVDALRRFWKTGRDSWKRVAATVPSKKSPGRKAEYEQQEVEPAYTHGHKLAMLRAEAGRVGFNYDTLKKAWKAGKEYTQEQIDELCELVVEHEARFGATHLLRLLAIEDREVRDEMARSAMRGRWGVMRLERAIRAVNGRREHVGKRPHIPDDQQELLNAIVSLCEKWVRFSAGAKPKLSGGLKSAVKRATEAVVEAQGIAEAALGRHAEKTSKKS